LWILDFDKACVLDFEEDPIPKLKRGVCGNDPYFPHPRQSPDLYDELAKVYLVVSEIILKSRDMSEDICRLPRRFLDAWEAWAQEDELDIVFNFD